MNHDPSKRALLKTAAVLAAAGTLSACQQKNQSDNQTVNKK